MGRKALPRPDWGYWANQTHVKVYEAVALSCDIDPRAALVEQARKLPNNPSVRQAGPLATLSLRLAWATNAASAKKLGPIVRQTWFGASDGLLDRPVTLAEFRAWGESLPQPLTFPPKFPGGDKPVGTTERETLLKLIAVLCELSGFDLRKETKGHAEAASIAPELEARRVHLSARTVADKLAAARMLIAPKGPGRVAKP